jgi:hypothetical protein
VNNAAYRQALEEEPLSDGLYAEIEHRGPCGPGEARLLSDDDHRWITTPDGTVTASFLLA